MARTKLDLITYVFRALGITAVDEVPDASEYAFASDVVDQEFARIKAEQGFTWTWTIDEIPDEGFAPLAVVMAGSIGSAFGRPVPPQSRGIMALRAWSFPDDREDPADTDDSGTVTTAEADAYDRAAYY